MILRRCACTLVRAKTMVRPLLASVLHRDSSMASLDDSWLGLTRTISSVRLVGVDCFLSAERCAGFTSDMAASVDTASDSVAENSSVCRCDGHARTTCCT